MINAPVPGPYHAWGTSILAIDHGRTYTIARAESCKLTPEALKKTALFLAHAANCHDDLVRALIGAIEGAGFEVSGPTDVRAAEHGEPAWVCNARAVLAEAAR